MKQHTEEFKTASNKAKQTLLEKMRVASTPTTVIPALHVYRGYLLEAPDAENHGSRRIQDSSAINYEVCREFLTAPLVKILLEDLSLEPGPWEARVLEV
ncbi:hypothetical protein FRB99_007596 [Tulasnella sp. 403]|nr:hypothetical protein FRB99_007596 [Tulasnella sp. 403]